MSDNIPNINEKDEFKDPDYLIKLVGHLTQQIVKQFNNYDHLMDLLSNNKKIITNLNHKIRLDLTPIGNDDACELRNNPHKGKEYINKIDEHIKNFFIPLHKLGYEIILKEGSNKEELLKDIEKSMELSISKDLELMLKLKTSQLYTKEELTRLFNSLPSSIERNEILQIIKQIDDRIKYEGIEDINGHIEKIFKQFNANNQSLLKSLGYLFLHLNWIKDEITDLNNTANNDNLLKDVNLLSKDLEEIEHTIRVQKKDVIPYMIKFLKIEINESERIKRIIDEIGILNLTNEIIKRDVYSFSNPKQTLNYLNFLSKHLISTRAIIELEINNPRIREVLKTGFFGNNLENKLKKINSLLRYMDLLRIYANAAILKEFYDKKRIEEDSILDNMTGLLRKKSLEIAIDDLLMEISENINFSLIFFDIDFFKKVNDTFGHTNGDVILKEVANIIKKYTKGHGNGYRFGGEEFVVLLLNCTSKEALSIGEQIRKEVKNSSHNWIKEEGYNGITISGGISNFPLNIDHKIKEELNQAIINRNNDEIIRIRKHLLDIADMALYRAKDTGKDKVLLGKTS